LDGDVNECFPSEVFASRFKRVADFTKEKRQEDNVRLPNKRGGCRGTLQRIRPYAPPPWRVFGYATQEARENLSSRAMHPKLFHFSTTDDSGLHCGTSEGSIYWNVAT